MERNDLNLLVGSNLRKARKDRFFVLAIKVFFHVILFYMFSILLSVFNSYIISKNQYNFSFPLFITSMHTMLHFIIAYLLDYYVLEDSERSKLIVDKPKEPYYPIVFCGIAAGLDIGLSNYSLKIVSLSFYTMVKSSTPIFILMFSFLLKLEKMTIELLLIIGLIGVGVFLTSWSETRFDLFGFWIVMMASFMAGIRWTLTQILLQKHSYAKENNPINTMKKISPIVSITLFICSSVFEGWDNILNSEFFDSFNSFIRSVGIIFTGGLMAFCLLLIEFRLISITSVITLSISGIFKEILTVTISVLIFDDKILFVNILGLVISITGMNVI